MGLDMYLTKKIYIKNWEHTSKEYRSKLSLKIGGKKIDTKKAKHVELEVAYWRNANMIHQWFIENVQEGVDNCAQYYVDYQQLVELYKICVGVKELFEQYGASEEFEKLAKEVLPNFFISVSILYCLIFICKQNYIAITPFITSIVCPIVKHIIINF